MGEVNTIGLDLAKNVFQAHGADASGAVLFRRKLRRHQVLTFFAAQRPCTVAMEACSSSHYWAREIAKLGHHICLISPAYVKTLCEASEERCRRCGGDLRGRPTPDHALCGAQE